MKFGLWTVIEQRGANALCRCDCGTERQVQLWSLRAGRSKSCGCSHGQANHKGGRRGHGATNTPTYNSWRAMRRRCEDPNRRSYERYGGRGISVCERWQTFENFLTDMGERPAGLTIDRVNEDGHYEPGNCRWASQKEQCRHLRGVTPKSAFKAKAHD